MIQIWSYLNGIPRGQVDWNQHLADLTSIFKYCIREKKHNQYPRGKLGFLVDFPRFIYSRAYLKIGARLDNGCRLWNLGSERHVLEHIHDWYQNPDPARIPGSCAIPARDGRFPKRLLEYDVAPDLNDMIHLNAGNVQQWTRFILSLYKDMEFLLPIFRSDKANVSAPLDVAQVIFSMNLIA